MRFWPRLLAAAVPLSAVLLASACAPSAASGGKPGTITAVGAENEYANVIGQIGGRYVTVSAIMSNPNTDPHTFEASSSVAQKVGSAQLAVQNGLGYDTFMNTIEKAAPGQQRKVVDVQKLLGLPDSTPNPHLWYKPGAMLAVAGAVAGDLASLQPSHASYFRANARRFDSSLTSWTRQIAAFRSAYRGVPVATTEPVADYMLQAAGADNMTPWTLQADVMNGVDPSPQAVAREKSLIAGHKVKALVYNQQVTDPLTKSFIALAHENGVPVLGVYETMPAPGYDYQSWMTAEVRGLRNAVANGKSEEKL